MNSFYFPNGFFEREHRLIRNFDGNSGQLNDFEKIQDKRAQIDEAADRLQDRVEQALTKAGKVEAFQKAESTEDLDTRVKEVVEMDVHEAETFVVDNIEKELEEAGYIARIEGVEVELPSREELVMFINEYQASIKKMSAEDMLS